MVRQHGIIPWDLYSLVLTHPTGGDRTMVPRWGSLAKIIRVGFI
ncbi:MULTISPECIES: hypothetical protein [Oscillatoriales]